MQRLFNLNKWVELEEGAGVSFPSTKPRLVRLEVNAPGVSFLYVSQDQDPYDQAEKPEPVFLARVEGRDTLEWHTSGGFSLIAEGGPCNVYTVDGDDVSFVNLSPTVFTRIAERRKRSPELEYIAAMMQRNMERRLDQQAAELRTLFERREAAREAQQQAQGVPAHGREPATPDVDPGDGEDPPAARKGRRPKGGDPDAG